MFPGATPSFPTPLPCCACFALLKAKRNLSAIRGVPFFNAVQFLIALWCSGHHPITLEAFSLILLEGGEDEIKTVYKLIGTVVSRARKADKQDSKRKS